MLLTLDKFPYNSVRQSCQYVDDFSYFLWNLSVGKCLSHSTSRILSDFVVEGRTYYVWLVFYSPIVFLSLVKVYVAVMPKDPKQPEDAIALGKKGAQTLT